MSQAEQITAFTILAVNWKPGGDELTLTRKLRRAPVTKKYAAEVEDLYARAMREAPASRRCGIEIDCNAYDSASGRPGHDALPPIRLGHEQR
jgi:hypothetical protein